MRKRSILLNLGILAVSITAHSQLLYVPGGTAGIAASGSCAVTGSVNNNTVGVGLLNPDCRTRLHVEWPNSTPGAGERFATYSRFEQTAVNTNGVGNFYGVFGDVAVINIGKTRNANQNDQPTGVFGRVAVNAGDDGTIQASSAYGVRGEIPNNGGIIAAAYGVKGMASTGTLRYGVYGQAATNGATHGRSSRTGNNTPRLLIYGPQVTVTSRRISNRWRAPWMPF